MNTFIFLNIEDMIKNDKNYTYKNKYIWII